MAENLHHEITREREPLSNHRGRSTTTIHGWSSVLFGLPFIAVGSFPILIANGVIPMDPDNIHAPLFVIGTVGGIFCFAGLFMCLHGLRGVLRDRRVTRERTFHPNEPWRYDYRWNPRGSRGEVGTSPIMTLVFLIFMAFFLVPFHWWGLYATGGTFVLIIVGFFDLIWLGVLGKLIYTLLQRFKYGSNELRFSTFPFYLGESVDAEIQCPKGIGDMDKLSFNLRFIEENYEIHGTGKSRKSVVVSYQCYSDKIVINKPLTHSGQGWGIPVHFDLPEDNFATDLVSRPPKYWELEVKAETPGINFQAVYLVPVYKDPN